KNELAIVGAQPHFYTKKENEENVRKDKSRLEEVTISYGVLDWKKPRLYTLLSSTGMFLSVEHLFTYTCLLPLEIHLLIDHCGCGADIAMNFLVGGMTRQRGVFVGPHGALETGDPRGSGRETVEEYGGVDLYTKTPQYLGQYCSVPYLSYHQKRARLVRELFYQFDNRDPLQPNNFYVTQYTKIPVRKKSPKQWHGK
ncbi:MAG: uncharacterized protein A8A55_2455, partial [Amphiamblys sp. WSBS2006]